MSFYGIKKISRAAWCNSDFYKLQNTEFYEQKITMHEFWDANEPILLQVENQDEATGKEYWAYRDFFVWKIGSPSAYVMVVSAKMREIIDNNLIIPPHEYYRSVVENYRNDESSADYFVLHFIHDFYEEIEYEKSKFGIINIIEEKLISELPSSIVNSKANITTEEQKQWADGWTNGVKPLKLALTKDYDIIGVNNMIYISPKAYQLFIDNNLTGIDFIPYTSEKISSTTVPEIIYQNEE